MKHPYPVPARLAPDLARVEAYWKGLLRGAAEMPFADDARLADLPDLSDRLMLIDVFDRPERFRFETIGKALGAADLTGRFLDETETSGSLEFLRSQCAATIECRQPTFFRHEGDKTGSYARLLLPMWGEGRIGALLGAVEFG